MNPEDREQLLELSRKYCSASVEHGWCGKHECDFCSINSSITEMLANIDSIAEEKNE